MESKNLCRKNLPKTGFIGSVLFLLFALFSLGVNAQQTQVNGKVTSSSDGEALPGVSIIVKGTSTGTVTDVDGAYSLAVPSNGTLVFSFIGFEDQEVPVNGRTRINVTLVADVTDIEEVVVVGYGVQKKVNLSGAVDAIDAQELESRPITNLSQGLQGVAPNLNIDFASGSPGATAQINIRGVTSINGGSPLILIDNVPASSAELNRLAPEDVAEISVLKDAASAAIYGARAAFGVVLITTKAGQKEGMFVRYTNSLSWSKPSILPEKITDPYIYARLQELSSDNTPWDYINYSDEFYAWAKERSDNPEGTDGVRVNPQNPNQWQYLGNRDWTNYFLSDYTMSQKHHLQVDGRTAKTSYYLSGSYDDENGALTIADDFFKRYSFRSKVDYKPFKWLNVGNNTFFSATQRNSPYYLSIGDIYNLEPTTWDKNPDGSWANTGAGIEAAQLTEGGEVDTKYYSIQSTFSAQASFFDNSLRINSDFTFRKGTQNYRYYQSKYNIGYGPEDIREIGSNRAYRSVSFEDYSVFNIFATYNKQFNQHEITALVGFNQEENRSEWFSASRDDVITRSLPTIALATGEDYVGESISSWAVRGAFFRFNYIFKDRYIVEFNGRYDGSSRFPSKDRFGFFPSASAAWRVDQESFMEGAYFLSNLKLRGSFGSLGNQNVSTYGYIPTMSTTEASYLVGGELPLRISYPGLVSDNYSWEKVETTNFGVDVGIFDNTITASFDAYRRNTIGMLTVGKDLPNVLGASEPSENAADLRTDGWELSVSYQNHFDLAGDPFYLNAKLILSDSKAMITKYDNPTYNLGQYYVGREFGEIWGLESDGMFETAEEIRAFDESQIIPWGALSIVPGWPKYVDQDGNGIIEKGRTLSDLRDYVKIGNSSSRYRFGVNLGFTWKGFDMRAFVQGIGKKDMYPQHYLYWGFYQQPYEGGYVHLLDFYRPEDDSEVDMAKHSQAYIDAGLASQNLDAKFPILQAWLADYRVNNGLAIPQTGHLLNAGYVRLKNLTVGYTIPKSLTRKVGLEKVRLFVSGENLYEWSEVRDYFDPEAATSSTSGYVYPFQRKYAMGVNIDF